VNEVKRVFDRYAELIYNIIDEDEKLSAEILLEDARERSAELEAILREAATYLPEEDINDDEFSRYRRRDLVRRLRQIIDEL
jgi:hypothetical protein